MDGIISGHVSVYAAAMLCNALTRGLKGFPFFSLLLLSEASRDVTKHKFSITGWQQEG